MEPYVADMLPLAPEKVDQMYFINELVDAVARLEVYKEKIKDSKLDSAWFMPTLQQKEAVASSLMEGTQATLDGMLINQAMPDKKTKDIEEVNRYLDASLTGYRVLRRTDEFPSDLILEIHKKLMKDSCRKSSDEVGTFRKKQNYIGRMNGDHGLVFTPPAPEDVEPLMENLVEYIKDPKDNFREIVRAAIIHAQFLTIHPFMDGNGRVGRLLIPLYLYYCKQIDLPCFFISEALERDKFKYYKLLNDIRSDGNWNEWIKFFLLTVTKQCDKYIKMISDINDLYNTDLEKVCEINNSGKMVDVINLLYQYPVVTSNILVEKLSYAPSTANRYLKLLVDNNVLYTDQKSRNKTYFYYDLLNILRD